MHEHSIYGDDLIFYQEVPITSSDFSLIQRIGAFPNVCACQIYFIAQTNFYWTNAAASLGQISEKPLGQHFVAQWVGTLAVLAKTKKNIKQTNKINKSDKVGISVKRVKWENIFQVETENCDSAGKNKAGKGRPGLQDLSCLYKKGRSANSANTRAHACRSVHTDCQPVASLGWVSCMGCRPGRCQIRATPRENDMYQTARLASDRADKASQLEELRSTTHWQVLATNLEVLSGELTKNPHLNGRLLIVSTILILASIFWFCAWLQEEKILYHFHWTCAMYRDISTLLSLVNFRN